MKTEDLLAMGNESLFNTYKRDEKLFISGKGAYLKNNNDEVYIDFVSGIATNILGHANDKIVEAISKQAAKLMHTSNLFWNQPAIELSHKLVNSTGAGSLAKVFFTNSGAEANEGALKLARKYGKDTHGDGCTKIISLTDSFHGRTMATLTATGQTDMHEYFKPLLPGSVYVPLNDSEALKSAADAKTCAVLFETIQGEGGINTLSSEFIATLKSLQQEKDILLIIDEVQTGMGRTGTLFSFEQFGFKPDIITLAKGLGAGYPIGAFVATDAVADHFKPGDHGTTLGGNPLAAAVGNAVFDEIFQADLLNNSNIRGQQLADGLRQIAKNTGVIAEVKGLGLLIGVQFTDAVSSADILNACFEENMLVAGAKHNVIRLLPPLNVTETEIDEALLKFASAVEKNLK